MGVREVTPPYEPGVIVSLCLIFWWLRSFYMKYISYAIQCVEKCLIGGVLANLCRKVSFWGPYWPWSYFSRALFNLSRRDSSFKYPYDYVLDFFEKSGKISRNFVTITLITHFCIRITHSHFLIWWILRKLAFPVFFGGFLMKKLCDPPWKELEKNNLNMMYIISKILPKDVFSFFKKSENCQNQGFF